MHGTSGQYRLDMKRDDPRTLMLKMDARLTFAGRERNVALQLEGERQMKHIEWRRQLSQAEFKRQEKDVRRRMEFFQTMIEENRMLQRTTNSEVNLFETQIEAEKASSKRRWSRLPPMPARRKKAHLDRAENVGSVRREQQAYTNNRSQGRFLNHSLNELNNSYKKHQTQKEANEAKLSKIREEISTIGRPKPKPEPTQPSLPQLQASYHEPTHSKSKRKSQPQTISLPELPKVHEEQMVSGSRGRKVSISHRMISSDDLRKLPGITVTADGRSKSRGGNQTNLGGNFYIDTSHSQTVGRRRRDSIKLITLNKPKPAKAKSRNVHSPRLPIGTNLPTHFYEDVYEDNPFLTEDFKPEAVRKVDKTSKSDEMYAWLGLDSLEELQSLRGGDIIGVGKEGEDDMEWVEIESTSDVQSNPDTAPNNTATSEETSGRTSRKRVYRIGGSIDLGSAANKFNPLKKFTSAARTLMVIRKLQDEAGCIPETPEAEPAAKETQEETVGDKQDTNEESQKVELAQVAEEPMELVKGNAEVVIHSD